MPDNRHADILATARARFRIADDAERANRLAALDDVKFRALEQWPEHIKAQREREKRPCLTLDRLGQYVRQVVNDIRQNRPSIQVNPVDSAGDKKTAEIIQGLVRHIEQNSGADIAYDTAAEYAVTIGFGYFRIRTEYADPMSFDQDILIEPIQNPFSVYLDPAAVRPDRSDASWGFITTYFPIEDFKADFPKSLTAAGLDGLSTVGDSAPGWLSDKTVRVAEYYWIETEQVEIALLADGTVLELAKVPEGASIIKTRTAAVPRVKWAKITGSEILEERELPGTIIPIIAVVGQEIYVDGERRLSGVIRASKEAQMQYNFQATAETEAIALAPKAPFIGAEGQFEGHEAEWATANNTNRAYLEYKPVSLGGQLEPPPRREAVEPSIAAISAAMSRAAGDMNASIGLYDAALGARSNETSGKAILARQREGDVGTFHYSDNLARAIRVAGRILLQWIPVYYDAARTVRIIGEDGSQETVQINTPIEVEGEQRIYDLTTGKYDVTVTVGPSFSTKRQEAVESMTAFAQAVPALVPRFADLYARMMDWPYADELAERLVPPDVQQKGKEQQAVPPQIQQRLMQMDQVIQALTQQLNQASDEIRTKRLELESRERIATLQAQVKLLETQAKIGSAEGIEMLRQEISALGAMIQQQQAEAAAEEAAAAEADQVPAEPAAAAA